MLISKSVKIFNMRTGGLGKCIFFFVVSSLSAKKIALQKIFGSNLYLKNKKVSGMAQTHNETLAAARENSEKLDSNLLTARLYSLARNYFIKNS